MINFFGELVFKHPRQESSLPVCSKFTEITRICTPSVKAYLHQIVFPLPFSHLLPSDYNGHEEETNSESSRTASLVV